MLNVNVVVRVDDDEQETLFILILRVGVVEYPVVLLLVIDD